MQITRDRVRNFGRSLRGAAIAALFAAGVLPGTTPKARAQCMDLFQGGEFPSRFAGANRVDGLAVHDDGGGPALYAVGNFTANGQNIDGLFRWNGTSWGSPLGAMTGTANAITSWGGSLYICGPFTAFGGSPASRIVRYDGSGFHAMGAGIDVGTAMAGTASGLYIAGPTHAGGLPVNNLARWDGAAWSAVGAPGPGYQAHHAMAYDAARQRVVLFAQGEAASETYEWAGAGWTRVAVGGPSLRQSPALAFDAGRGVTVLFGGITSAGPQGDTWEWDGATWTPRAIAGPDPRFEAAMAYDPLRGRIVLNGGRDQQFNRSGFRETWEYDGAAWTLVSTTGPERRSNHGMVFDDALGRTVLYGGSQDGSNAFTHWVWTWDGTTWTHPASSAGPGFRPTAALAYDAARQKVVLFSGGSAPASDLWEWDGSAWATNSRPNPPTPRTYHAAAYDAARGTVVFSGGQGPAPATQSETWTFTGTDWASFMNGVNGPVSALAAFDDGGGEALFVGGQFSAASGVPASGIARLRAGLWNGLGGGLSTGSVTSLAVYRNALVAGGGFTAISGVACNNLARWNGAWARLDMGQQGSITALGVLPASTPILVAGGGPFPIAGYAPGSRMAAWDGSARLPLPGHQTATPARFAAFPYQGAPALWMSTGDTIYQGLWVLGSECRPPEITAQPQSITAIVGQDAVFSVTATGTATLTYQWRKDGQPINDLAGVRSGTHTAQLRIFGWSLSDAGPYDCTVTNSVGSATSDTATLTVNGSTPGGPVAVTPIAVTGQPVPDRPNFTYSDLGAPILSEDGTVAFQSSQNGAWAVSRWRDGVASTLLIPGSPLPGMSPAATLTATNGFSLGAGGELFADVTGNRSGSSFNGAWRAPVSGPLTKVAAWGDTIPGTGGATVAQFNTSFSLGGEGGHSAFRSQLRVSNQNRDALLRFDPADGSLAALAMTGTTPPGVPLPVLSVGNSNLVKPSAAGSALIELTIDRTSVIDGNSDRDWGYWAGPPGALAPVAVRGDPVPGRPGAVVAGAAALQADSGAVAFGRVIFDPATGYQQQLALWSDGVERVLLTQGDEVAPGERADAVTPVAVNGNGEVLARVQSRPGGACCSFGYWVLAPDAAPVLVARNGTQTLLGFPPGFSQLSVGIAAMNANGMVVLQADASGPGGSGTAVLGWTRAHGLFPIVVPGTQVQTGPGVYQTAVTCTLSPDYAGVVGPIACRSVNDSGRVAVWVRHMNGSRSVLVGDFSDFVRAWYPCAAVIEEPRDQTVRAGATIALDAGVTAAPDAEYAWSRDGVPLADGGRFSGAATAHLRVASAASADSGDYRLSVTDSCGVVTTRGASVLVPCPPDFNADGFLDFFDYDDYVNCFENGACPPGRDADYNGDDFADFFDYDAFVGGFEAGC